MQVNLHLFDIEVYRREVEPAIDAYVNDGDPRGALGLLSKVASSTKRLAESDSAWVAARLDLDGAREVLSGRSSYGSERGFSDAAKSMGRTDRKEFAELYLASAIVSPLCVPWNTLGQSQPFAYFRSDAIRKHLGARGEWLVQVAESERLLRGPDIKYPIGRSGRIVLRSELETVRAAVEARDDSPKKDGCVAHLRLLVEECFKHDRFTLLYSLMP